MKKYIVGVNQAAGIVELLAYESKDIMTADHKCGLTYQQMLGSHFMGPMIETTRKDEAQKFIKDNYPAAAGWVVEDHSDFKITSPNSNEHKKMPFSRNVATPISAFRKPLISAFHESENVLGFYFNAYQYDQPNGEVDLIRINSKTKEKKHQKFKTVDDAMQYLLKDARRAVDQAKNKKQLSIAQLYLKNAMYVFEQYQACSRLVG